MRSVPRPLRFQVISSSLICAASLMNGCGSGPSAVPAPPAPIEVTAFSGHVYAAGQPVNGASVTLYAAGNAGNGLGATNLSVAQESSTDAAGAFGIAAGFTCPSATTPAYLVARGGNPEPTGDVNNHALLLITAIGDCGGLAGGGTFVINEVTTVAAAWSLASFLGTNAIIGSSSTNANGLRSAFALSARLADPTKGTAPGQALPASAKLETAKLNTLADALAVCSHSDGGSSCNALFVAAAQGTTMAANTLDGALSIIRNPGSNVTGVFEASNSQTVFGPKLSSAPHDWTISVTYGNCTSGCGGLSIPGGVAIDSTGSVWVANFFGNAVSKFSPLGVPEAANGFPGIGLTQSYGIAVDGQDNIWVSNQQSVTAANNHHYGSLSKFSSSGQELSGAGYTAGGVFYPKAIAADSNGNIWSANYGNSSATLLANDGTAISGASGFATSQVPFTEAIAVDGNHNAWLGGQGVAVRVNAQGVVSSFACCDDPEGIAIDRSGKIWISDYGGFGIVELSNEGMLLRHFGTASGNIAPLGIATDGAGNVWTANYYGNSMTEVLGATTEITSPAAGFGLDASLSEPYGLAIDAGGNLWISNSGNNTLTQFIGLASPVRTPMQGLPVQP